MAGTPKVHVLTTDLLPLNNAIENINEVLDTKVDKVEGKGLSTNDLTNELVEVINGKKVKDVAGDNVNKTIKVTFTDDSESVISLADLVTDIHVNSAEFNATTNVITLNKANSDEKITIDLTTLVPNIDLEPLETAISEIEESLETKTNFTESGTEPTNPKLGDEWSNTTDGVLYKWMNKDGITGWHEIGGTNPRGDLQMAEGASIVLVAPDGSKYKVSIENGGRLTSTLVVEEPESGN